MSCLAGVWCWGKPVYSEISFSGRVGGPLLIPPVEKFLDTHKSDVTLDLSDDVSSVVAN